MLRYDLEVSGFPSSHCGRLVLLRLWTMDYPGASLVEEWPSTTQPILQWAREQGAVLGYAHAGLSLWANTADMPNEMILLFDGIGANDCIVNVTAGLVDIIGIGDTIPFDELNIWYHLLSSGYRLRIGGETDWPCLTDRAVGGARSNVRIAGSLSYDAWCDALKIGYSYVSEGRTHLLDFAARAAISQAAVLVGDSGDLALTRPGRVIISGRFGGLLQDTADQATETIRSTRISEQRYWHIERA